VNKSLADPIEEQELVERLKKGQQWAYQVLVTRYQDRLLKIAYGITLDMEESREVVQDVFVSVFKHIHSFREEAGLWGWLRRITINACLNWKRKWKRRFKWHHTSLEPDNDHLLYGAQKDSATPESILGEKEGETNLVRAIHKLPEKNRLVFVLNTLEGLSYEEIAQTLKIRKGTVASRLFHARKQILASLNHVLNG
jgi:RNA polymerase sigma-70 factor (ECF subfamily)